MVLDACQNDFMLVGGGAVLDAPTIKPRLECGLGSIPALNPSFEGQIADLQAVVGRTSDKESNWGLFRLLEPEYKDAFSRIGILTFDTPDLRVPYERFQKALESQGLKVTSFQAAPGSLDNIRTYVQPFVDKADTLVLAVEVVIMRRLTGTSEITRMAVTLVLLLGIFAALNWIWDPSAPKVVRPMFDGRAVVLWGQRLPLHDLLVMALALAVGAALRWLLYRSRAGMEMRGAVDDPTLMVLNGLPVQAAQLSWVTGTTTAVLTGVLIAPRTSLAAGALSLLVMNAFAAAVVGRLRSLPLTILGATILGLSTAYAQGYIGSRPDLPAGRYLIGLVNIVPVIVLFTALQFLPQARLRQTRAARAREISERPTWSGSLVLALLCVLVTAALAPLLSVGDLHNMTNVWGVALIALSLVPLLGWAGRLAVCPFAFAAIGAVTVAHLAPAGQLWSLVLAGLAAALVGALLSFPGARLSPLYLARATAAFAVACDNWLWRLPPFDLVLRVPLTNRTLYRQQVHIFQGGALEVNRPHLPGLDLSGDHAFLLFGAVVFALALLALTALRRSDLGLRMLALKDSPLGYATVGLDGRLADFRTPEYSWPRTPVDLVWETTRGMGAGFGYNAEETDAHRIPIEDLVGLYRAVRRAGGRMLLNVGPHANGTIPEPEAARLLRLGELVGD